jgi:hypothetical protein
MKKFGRPMVIAVALLPLALMLGGCSLIPSGPSVPNVPAIPGDGEQVDDELVEEMVEGSGNEVDFEMEALPADFPVNDVPLVDGEVGPSMSISDGLAWTVTIYTADEATANSAPDLLEQAGFSNESGIFWETSDYLVIITATGQDDDGKWYVHYQVQRQQ